MKARILALTLMAGCGAAPVASVAPPPRREALNLDFEWRGHAYVLRYRLDTLDTCVELSRRVSWGSGAPKFLCSTQSWPLVIDPPWIVIGLTEVELTEDGGYLINGVPSAGVGQVQTWIRDGELVHLML